MTGRGEVGLDSPSLWNVKLTPMLFTDKVQWLLIINPIIMVMP